MESVFLNIPYDDDFETLYLAYIVGLTKLGLKINVTLAAPNQGRLAKIIELIEESDFSIHDLSRIELSKGIPRFNMPVELGIALYRSHIRKEKHQVHVFESEPYRTQRSTSDVNGLDAHIHGGKPGGVMSELRNLFRRPSDTTTVPEMLAIFREVTKKLPRLKKNAGGGTLYEKAIFDDIVLAALEEIRTRNIAKEQAARKAD
jgi:hypothetical protein